LWNSGVMAAPGFTAPVVANGLLLEGMYDNKLHAWGL
jgi:hypothetical protein